MGVSRAGNSVKNWRNLSISNPKPDLHNINAHTKFGENPLMFTYHPETKNGRTDKTDGLADNQCETIIPRHYCVAGYKNSAHKTYIHTFVSIGCFQEHKKKKKRKNIFAPLCFMYLFYLNLFGLFYYYYYFASGKKYISHWQSCFYYIQC